MTWPLLLDYSRDECKRTLRKLELDAYSSMVSVLRAQGELTKEKKKLLQELSSVLSISLERHRAEVRRAVNDEKLSTIADRMIGPNTGLEWAIEGRRLVPLMPRLVPQTVFTVLANNLANIQAAKNAAMPVPSLTGNKNDIITLEDLPSPKKRKRSSSSDAPHSPIKAPTPQPPSTPMSPPPPTQLAPPTHHSITPLQLQTSPTHSSIGMQSPPLISPQPALQAPPTLTSGVTSITPTTYAQGSTMSPTVTTKEVGGVVRGVGGVRGGATHRMIAPAQHSNKVIVLSGSGPGVGGANIPPSILQRCLSVPMPTSAKAGGAKKQAGTSGGGSNMVVYTTTTRGGGRGGAQTKGINNMGGVRGPRPRGQMQAQVQFPTLIGAGPRGGGATIRAVATPTSIKGTRMVSAVKGDAAVLKMSSQVISPSTRILPKPPLKGIPMSPITMVVGGPASKVGGAVKLGSPRIVNVMPVTATPPPLTVRQPPTNTYSAKGNRIQPKPITISSTSTSPIMTTSMLGGASIGGGVKPNVIVVHKAQQSNWPQQQQLVTMQPNKIQVLKKPEPKTVAAALKAKQDNSKGGSISLKRVTNPNATELDPTQLDPKSTILADLIQASGIISDGSPTSGVSLTAGQIKKIQTTPHTTTLLPTLVTMTTATSSPIPTSSMLAAKTVATTTVATTTVTNQPKLKKNEIVATTMVAAETEGFTVEIQDDSNIEYQHIQLGDQLQGQVLEIQAPDAANLLTSSGQLSKEVFDLLQQVGIHLNQDQVTLDTSGLTEQLTTQQGEESDGIEVEATMEIDDPTLKGRVQLDPSTGILFLRQEDVEGSDSNVVEQIVETSQLGGEGEEGDPFHNFQVGDCVTVSIGGEEEVLGESIEVATEMDIQ